MSLTVLTVWDLSKRRRRRTAAVPGTIWKSWSTITSLPLWCYLERATLAPYCATNQLQDLPSLAQLSGGYWSSLPIRVLQPGELRDWKSSPSFCCSISSGRASIPSGTLGSTRLLSCRAASVESTSLGCTKLWDRTGHFQKEAKNFFMHQ